MHQFNPESFNPLEAGPAMFRLWTDFLTKMMSGAIPSAETTPPDAARQFRSSMLGAWSDYWQQFMRSPEYLESLKRFIDATIQYRKQYNDWMGQVQHEVQGVSRQDIEQLMRMMRHVEQRALDSSDRIGDQLERLTRRLETLEERLEQRLAKRSKPQSHE